jgi:hypothetical protein
MLNNNFLNRLNDICDEILDAVRNQEDMCRVKVLTDNMQAMIRAEKTALTIAEGE